MAGQLMYTTKDRKFIGKKIKDRRNELGLTQERLAEAIGITYQQLQRYENGTSYVNTDRLQALSNVLKVPITFFFQGQGDEKIKVMESGHTFVSPEEKEFVEYLRKIDDTEHRKSIFIFLKLAAGKGKISRR